MHIVFTGGGSLGPVTPLIAVMRSLREKHPEARFSWIGTRGGVEERIVADSGMAFYAVSSGKLRRYFSWQNVSDLVRIVRGFVQAFFLLRSLKADVVVSAGGFVAVPVAWAAWLLGVPVHVHQQDVVPGLANKLTLPVAASLSVALQSSVADFPKHHPVWTGNPVRPEVLAGSATKARDAFLLEDGIPVVFVVGGGTGATGLNDLIRQALPMLTEKAQVIHSAGIGKTDATVGSPRYHQFEIITKEMPQALAAADLVVTRAGMGSLTELASLGKPTVIIPMPASHQEANARAFAKGGGALALDQRRLTAHSFASHVLELLGDHERRAVMAARMRSMNQPNAAQRIADTVLALAEKKRSR